MTDTQPKDRKPNKELQAAVQKLFEKHGIQAATLSYMSTEHIGTMLYQFEANPKDEREFLMSVSRLFDALQKAMQDRLTALGPDMEGTRPMEGGCPDGHNSPVFKVGGNTHWRKDDTCSYCGGLDPEKVLDLLKAGGSRVERCPEKNYKFYLHVPAEKASANGNTQRKVYLRHFSKEQIDKLNELVK